MNVPRHRLQPLDPSSSRPVHLPLWKRTLDLTVIIFTLPLVLPLMLFLALLIRLVSAGPIFFKQERVGFGGNRFMCFKFRTMRAGAEVATHQTYFNQLMNSNTPMVKMDSCGDSRIIPCGKWLRASGLDELPQIFNVLRGEMSLVGPRPCLPSEYACYLPWQKERFNAAPGLTGLWQVSGKNRTTFSEMIELDINYARRKTLSTDLKIMARTIPALIGQIQETPVKNLRALPVSRKVVLPGSEVEPVTPGRAAYN